MTDEAKTDATDLTTCPLCGADLVGDEIPENRRHMFGGATHGSKLVAVYDRDIDAVTHYECPACKGRIDSMGREDEQSGPAGTVDRDVLTQAVRAACNIARGENTDGKGAIIVGVVVNADTYNRLDPETRQHGIMTCNGFCHVVLSGDK